MTSSPKRVIYEVSDSDFEADDFTEKKAKSGGVECQICEEAVDTSELVECQAVKKSSAEATHAICIKCYSKVNKCPFCRADYDSKQEAPRSPSPILLLEEPEEEEQDDSKIRHDEFMRKVTAVGHSIRLMALYPRVRTWVADLPSTLSSSSLSNYQFFTWALDQEVRVHHNHCILRQVVDSNLRPEAVQLILFGEYKILARIQAERCLPFQSMIQNIFKTWCARSPEVLAKVVDWYRAEGLNKQLSPTQLVSAGLCDVPWPVMSKTIQDLGLALGRVEVTNVLAELKNLPPIGTVKGLGELDPLAVWNALKNRLEGNDQTIGLSKPWLELLQAIRPRGKSVSLWSHGQYDVESFQRNALIRQMMPEAVKTAYVNLAEDGKMGYAPRGMGTAPVWQPVLPHGRLESSDFFFVDHKHHHVLLTEAKLPGVAPNEKFVVVYYHNEHPRQYRVYVSIKAQGNTGLDRYLAEQCLPLPGTQGGQPFDGLWVPNAQFIVALKNKPRHNN